MDCSLADRQTSVNCLDESIKNLTESQSNSGSPLKCENPPTVKLRKYSDRCLSTTTSEAKTSSTYRISMANLEETQESELDVILGELSLLEAQINSANVLSDVGGGIVGLMGGTSSSSLVMHAAGSLFNTTNSSSTAPHSGTSTRTHSRTNSSISGATLSISGSSESGGGSSSSHSENGMTSMVVGAREPRTESPDNDSAFSDTVSLLSSESSASSSVSSAHTHHKQFQQQQQQQQQQQHQQQQQQQQMFLHLQMANNGIGQLPQQLLLDHNSKAAKIQLALHKLEHASIRRLFVKAFTADGASKSLLVDERMNCAHVTRLLADKNHVQMQANWALVENLGDLQMERLFEDHELLVDNLMTWNSDAGNRVLFLQRSDKLSLFLRPEAYLPGPQMAPGSFHDDHTRAMLLEEFFETHAQLQIDGPLYMKADSKKGWKRYHFVLRSSGLYYFPKEKTKNTRDLACLTLFTGYNVYRGINWKKKWKAPTDFTFGFKAAVDSSLGKTCRSLKMLCAEDLETLEKWLIAIRIAKYGKQLWENHKMLLDDLQRGSGGDALSISDGMSNSSFVSSMRSESISSISSAVPSQCGSVSSAISTMSSSSSGGRMSRASSSSSSGCLSDDNNGFDSEFTTGTIKRKPSMKPNLPLTTMTRQLKEVGEITICEADSTATGQGSTSPERSGTLTRRHSRRKSQESNGGSNSSGTLKKRQLSAATKRGSVESMSTSSSTNSTPTPTPSICSKPPLSATSNLLQADAVQMTSSTLSLDSLPPPPPPPPLETHELYGSQLSLVSLPPPPPPEDVRPPSPPKAVAMKHPVVTAYPPLPPTTMPHNMHSAAAIPPAVPAKPIKPAVKVAPPYKAPPDYVGIGANYHHSNVTHAAVHHPSTAPTTTATNSAPTQKKVSFADSPVLLRRKMCSPEPRSPPTMSSSPHLYSVSSAMRCSAAVLPCPLPPPRADATRLSVASSSSSSQDYGSPKRLQESTSNPPRDFLKDLQRVMRKKWQVAQKCKLEPATTPHEVLGFRDFSDELLTHNLNSSGSNSSSHYYRETANVSNWVQEHYGAGAPPPLAGEYALYENLNNTDAALLVEPQFPIGVGGGVVGGGGGSGCMAALPASGGAASMILHPLGQRKKRPPPPPPKRSDSTHLSHRV